MKRKVVFCAPLKSKEDKRILVSGREAFALGFDVGGRSEPCLVCFCRLSVMVGVVVQIKESGGRSDRWGSRERTLLSHKE